MITLENTKGYILQKKDIAEEELIKIKDELTVTPKISSEYVKNPESYKIFYESKKYIYLPRFYGRKKFGLPKVNKLDIKYTSDRDVKFTGTVRSNQAEPIKVMKEHLETNNGGVMNLETGQGKTVIGIYLACYLKGKTLILVTNDFLLNQWIERIRQFTNGSIGIIKQNKIDIEDKDFVIGMVQSISMREYDPVIFQEFRMTIIDEVHHMGSKIFSRALRKINTPYVLGLSATPTRKDGLSKVFYMNIGNLAYSSKRSNDSVAEVNQYFLYYLDTKLSSHVSNRMGGANIPAMTNNIVKIDDRMKWLANMVIKLYKKGRKILILSDRRNYVIDLVERLKPSVDDNVGYIVGSMKQEVRELSLEKDIIIGTYQMVSEGFDCKKLDTLILATSKVDIEQSVGRILRKEVYEIKPLIIDIVDYFSIFPRQGMTRRRFYKKKKYTVTTKDIYFNDLIEDSASSDDINNEGVDFM